MTGITELPGSRASAARSVFEDKLDYILMISSLKGNSLCEDFFYCGKNADSAAVSVFDGCGGLGARKYDSFRGHTGAYLASRLVSVSVKEWYRELGAAKCNDTKAMADSLREYIEKNYSWIDRLIDDNGLIKGSMKRKLPTTMALACAEAHDDAVCVHIIWAGDSRIYILDDNGLSQLTIDDTSVKQDEAVTAAIEDFVRDAPMTNVIAADGKYELNCRSLQLTGPAIIIAATDGCYGYVNSPIEFEYIILRSLCASDDTKKFSFELEKSLEEKAGDDFTMSMMSIGYGGYNNIRDAFKSRYEYIESEYMKRPDDPEWEELFSLWEKYRPGYMKYIDGQRDTNE